MQLAGAFSRKKILSPAGVEAMDKCPRHGRELTQDHFHRYDELYSRFGAFVLGDMCVCEAIAAFRSNKMMLEFEREFKEYARRREVEAELALDRARRKEEKLESAGRWYFITFTRHESERDPSNVLKSTMRLIRSKQVSPIQWCYSLELTEKGTPHTHIRLFTNKYFDYKKVGNFNDGFRYDVQKEKMNCANYIVKQESKPDENYLKNYGLENYFFCSENYTGPKPGEKNISSDLEEKNLSFA